MRLVLKVGGDEVGPAIPLRSECRIEFGVMRVPRL